MVRAIKLDAINQAEWKKIVKVLAEENAALDTQWRRLREPLLSLAEGRQNQVDIEVNTFTTLYQHHLHHEDCSVLPFARMRFGKTALEKLRDAILARHEHERGWFIP